MVFAVTVTIFNYGIDIVRLKPPITKIDRNIADIACYPVIKRLDLVALCRHPFGDLVCELLNPRADASLRLCVALVGLTYCNIVRKCGEHEVGAKIREVELTGLHRVGGALTEAKAVMPVVPGCQG